jgi:hypothetical protein
MTWLTRSRTRKAEARWQAQLEALAAGSKKEIEDTRRQQHITLSEIRAKVGGHV